MPTPVKTQKGQDHLDAADLWLSRAVSQLRQPAESIFNWIEKKTGIETVGKMRSCQGLLVHVFSRHVCAERLAAKRLIRIVALPGRVFG